MPSDFVIHEVINKTLVRVMYREQPGVVLELDHISAVNAFLRPIIEDSPIHVQLPQPYPRCAACRKED